MTNTDSDAHDAGGSWPHVRRMLGYASPYRLRLALAVVCLLAAAGAGLAYPRYFGRLVDASFTQRDADALGDNVLALVMVFVLQAVFVFFRHYLFGSVGERVVADLRVTLYRHLCRLSATFFHTRRTGELLSRLGEDVSKMQGTISSDLSIVSRSTVTLAGGIVILWISNPLLTGAMLAVVPPLVLASIYFGRRIRRLAKRARDKLAEANARAVEGIGGIETVQAFTREAYEIERFQGTIDDALGLFIRRVRAGSWFMSSTTVMAGAAIVGIFWLGGTMVVQEKISPGGLAEFMLYTVMVASSVGSIATVWTNLQSAVGATTRLFELLDTEPEIDSPAEPEPLEDVRGEVRFEQVTFAYDDRDGPVLSNIELHIPAGQSCALVGSSGSGKTTLSRLVLRFHDPVEGRITLDGHDLKDLDLQELRGQISLVAQEPMLFSGTVEENIRYGRLDATDEEVREAARKANADEFIEGFPSGYQTRVGERGVQLSGGQRQRVAIARAILREPKVLVLDEATSALDAQSEGKVQEALDRLKVGRTTITIAHRLSTIFGADRIVVLERGQIVEEGRHEALLAAGGVYARLVARQAEAMRDGGGPEVEVASA